MSVAPPVPAAAAPRAAAPPRPAHALPLEYVLLLRWPRDADPRDAVELASYLKRLSTWLPVIVVDGSEPDVWDRHHALFAPYAHHVVPQPWPGPTARSPVSSPAGPGSRGTGGLADDDVRWERDGLERRVGLLEGCTLVRPQNVFAALPWHARWDTARSLLNRAVGADYPGTYGVRRSAFLAAGGYDGDVLFELELARPLCAADGSERLVADLYVPGLPPTTRHFLGQRVRQAHDDLAQPAQLAAEAALAPAVLALTALARRPQTRRAGRRGLALLVAGSVGLAEVGRRRAGGNGGLPARRRILGPAVARRTGHVRLTGARAPGPGRGAVWGQRVWWRRTASGVCVRWLRGYAERAMTINLGLPALPPPTLAPRRKTRKIKVGKVDVGGDAPISVQSMTTTLTSNINATLQQIAELTATGLRHRARRGAQPGRRRRAPGDRAQVADPGHRRHPLPAQVRLRRHRGGLRGRPGQPGQHPRVRRPGEAGSRRPPRTTAPRSGSASTRARSTSGCWRSTARPRPRRFVESALWEASLFEEHDFREFKISVKHNDPVVMVRAYELLSESCDYPLHLGVTEAGPAFQGTIKSAVAFGSLLSRGIGDTIRVSLSAPPVEEVKVGLQILQSLNLRPRKLEIVSCPSCGRAQVDVYKLADAVTAGLEGMTVPLRVAVMGCVVNGPGEAREADLGVASGNGKGQIFVRGEVIKTVPEADIVETLIEEAMRLADEMPAGDTGSPEVSVAGSAPVRV